MEPITIATSFASIVGLICNFRDEKKGQSEDEYKDFMEWLGAKRHTEMQDLLAENIGLSRSIENLLNDHSSHLSSKLKILENTMLRVASQIDSMSDVAQYFNSKNELSEQALEIITHVVEHEGSGIMENRSTGVSLLYVRPRNISIEMSEKQYIESDLASLVELGFLLRPEPGPSGSRLYSATREAKKLVENSVERGRAKSN